MDCAIIVSTSGALIMMDAEYSDSPLSDEFVIPKPPIRAEVLEVFVQPQSSYVPLVTL